MFTPYNERTASLEDRIAWALCQIIDDDAPLRWTRYRSAAVCIAANPEVMTDLTALAEQHAPGVSAGDGQTKPREDTDAPIPAEVGRMALEALTLIAGTDPVDAALDPQRAVRVARAAITELQQALEKTK